jgi:hypothetical protein
MFVSGVRVMDECDADVTGARPVYRHDRLKVNVGRPHSLSATQKY